jgi:hypothetical protein
MSTCHHPALNDDVRAGEIFGSKSVIVKKDPYTCKERV